MTSSTHIQGLAEIARHVTVCHLIKEKRDQSALDDEGLPDQWMVVAASYGAI